jgi:cytochrome c556
MQQLSRRLITLAAVLALFTVAACGAGDRPPQLDDSPEAAAYTMRDGLMQVVAWKLTQMRAMADGEIAADNAVFVKYAEDLTALAGMATEGFIPDSIVPGSRALPAIWQNWNDFERLAADFESSAQALAAAARSGGIAGSDAALRSFAQTCGNCHRGYRAPE